MEYFLFNLSLLVVILFVVALSARRKRNASTLKWMRMFYFIISLGICFLFSYPINDDILLDLRLIPIIIGSLYAGMGVVLGVLTVVIRGLYGFDVGFVYNALFYTILALLTVSYGPKFVLKPQKQRICILLLLSIAVGVIQSIGLVFLYEEPMWDAYIAYIFIQPVGVGFIAFFLEEICKSFKFNNLKVESKRLEAVEQMGAAISHEIRNPLTAALGFVQLLENDSTTEDERNLYLSILKRELYSAENVIHDYLTFSNPEIEKEKLDLVKEVSSVVFSLKPLAEQNGIRIISILPKSVMIEGDFQKLRQCLLNIMKNALEAMSHGGILKIKINISHSTAVIQIKDTGPGMTKEQLDRLGEPYYSTKGEKGTGLGLMVVFSIIRAMNGSILVESEIGSGTVFEILLPTIQVDAESTESLYSSQ